LSWGIWWCLGQGGDSNWAWWCKGSHLPGSREITCWYAGHGQPWLWSYQEVGWSLLISFNHVSACVFNNDHSLGFLSWIFFNFWEQILYLDFIKSMKANILIIYLQQETSHLSFSFLQFIYSQASWFNLNLGSLTVFCFYNLLTGNCFWTSGHFLEAWATTVHRMWSALFWSWRGPNQIPEVNE